LEDEMEIGKIMENDMWKSEKKICSFRGEDKR
jgi:hypothetical protein